MQSEYHSGHISHLPDNGGCGMVGTQVVVRSGGEVLDDAMALPSPEEEPNYELGGAEEGELDAARVASDYYALQETLVERALDYWCIPGLDGATTGRLCIHAEVSDRSMRALYALWSAWCIEEGTPLDDRCWAAHMVDRVMTASFMPIIMYDGDKPIGICDATFFTDPMTAEFTCFGDHAYVLPEYRKASVMRQLFEAFLAISQLCGATRCVGPVDSHKASFLQKLYEQYGGEQVATLMSWRP